MEALADLIDWTATMAAPRCAGGHDEVMQALFKGATVLAHWNENDYSGDVATAYRLSDGRVVLVSDSYGSCSGCDSWEDASDADARKLIADLAHNAHAFDSIEAAVRWIKESADEAEYFTDRSCKNLLPDLEKAAIGG